MQKRMVTILGWTFLLIGAVPSVISAFSGIGPVETLKLVGVLSPFWLVGGGILGFRSLRARRRNHLMQHGEVVEADVVAVKLDRTFTVNGENPFIVLCQWRNPRDQVVYRFKSAHIWFDPTDYLPSDRLKVYIDRNRPTRNHVDLSWLPTVVDA